MASFPRPPAVALAEKGVPNGVAGLDGSGKIIVGALPALAITSTTTVANQAAQLALSAQEGDVAVRTDESKTYIFNGGATGTMSDWTLLATPADTVLSVAGKTGAVTLTASDVGAAAAVHTHAQADVTGLVTTLEGKASAASVTTLTTRAARIDLGTDWSAGESQPIFTGNDAGGRNLEIKLGTEATPDESFKSPLRISRTLSVAESSFSGDGSIGLGAITAVTTAAAASQGQALGVVGGAVTHATYHGSKSHSDAFGGYFVGRAAAGSSCVGAGIFANGRRESDTAFATGAEIAVENWTAEAGTYQSAAYSDATGIFLAPKGESDSAAAVQIGHPSAVRFKVGYAVNKEAVTDSSFRDDSEAAVALDIRGEHANGAMLIAKGAGFVVIGASARTAESTQLLELNAGGSARNPILRITAGGNASQTIKFNVTTGSFYMGIAGGTDNLITGTAAGDGALYTDGTRKLNFGRTGERAALRVGNNVGIGVGAADSFGEGIGVLFLANAETAPKSNPTGGGLFFIEGGALKYRGSSGTVTTLAAA